MIREQQAIDLFLKELNELTAKHGIYIANLLDKDGKTKDNPYLIPIEKNVMSAGYRFHAESGEITYDWY